MLRFAFLWVFVAAACKHADENMTAQQHREAGTLHEAKADAERAQFDPTQTRASISRSPFSEGPDDIINEYNPTADHLVAADRELRRAAEHFKLAAKLDAFEDAACQQLPKEQRAACPLLASQVAQVQDLKKGVRLTLTAAADGAQIYARLNCHLAYANATGFDRPSCPLFVKGMTIAQRGPKAIELLGSDPEVARALQVQAHRIFVGGQPISAR